MPAIATLEELKAVEKQIEGFKNQHPQAFQEMVEILKRNRKIGYKNICKIFIGANTGATQGRIVKRSASRIKWYR